MNDHDPANGTQHEPAGEDLIGPAVKAVSEAITPLLKKHDPRALVQALLMNSVSLSTKIVAAKRWTNQDVAMEFSQALCATLAPVEESRIQVVDATGRAKR